MPFALSLSKGRPVRRTYIDLVPTGSGLLGEPVEGRGLPVSAALTIERPSRQHDPPDQRQAEHSQHHAHPVVVHPPGLDVTQPQRGQHHGPGGAVYAGVVDDDAIEQGHEIAGCQHDPVDDPLVQVVYVVLIDNQAVDRREALGDPLG